MDNREVYPNAPLVLATFELRHPISDPMTSKSLSLIKNALADEMPLMGETELVSLRAVPGAPPEMRSERVPTFTSRDRTIGARFSTESVLVETTTYAGYERLRDSIAKALAARATVGVDGITRIGLRYIDEIRVPRLDGPATAWSEWISRPLCEPAMVGADLELTASTWQGLVSFDYSENRTVVLRWGPGVGYAVSPDGPLQRTTPPPGPFFLLDIDSAWTASNDVPEFSSDMALEECDALHGPIRSLFENLITDQLRDEVLRG